VKRRTFIAGLGSAAAWPVVARGQTGKTHRIGFLSQGLASSPFVTAFREGLRELGYSEGQNISIEWRFSSRPAEEFKVFANELVGLKLEAIVTVGGPATRAMKQVTSTIPIVIAFSGDPVGAGLVESLSRPGANLTGLSFISPDLSAKRLEVDLSAMPWCCRRSEPLPWSDLFAKRGRSLAKALQGIDEDIRAELKGIRSSLERAGFKPFLPAVIAVLDK
jgi:putative ABC transport system substrate-binding protein